MRKLLYILFFTFYLLPFTSCKTRKVESQTQKVQTQQVTKSQRDSTAQLSHQSHSSASSSLLASSFELELESTTDSLGTPRELTFTRIRDGDRELIRVTNGKLKLRTASTLSKSQQQADSTLVYNSQATTKTEVKKHQITYTKQQHKETKSSPVRHAIWLLLIAILVYVIWRYKLFRWKI